MADSTIQQESENTNANANTNASKTSNSNTNINTDTSNTPPAPTSSSSKKDSITTKQSDSNANANANANPENSHSDSNSNTKSKSKSKPPKQKSKDRDVDSETSTANASANASATAAGATDGGSQNSSSDARKDTGMSADKLSESQLEAILKNNPALKSELAGLDEGKLREQMKGMGLEELLMGTAIGGKNQKNMASYKFWQTQPVPSFQEKAPVQEGPIKRIDPAQVPKEPSPFAVDGFEWVTMNLDDNKEVDELYDLLSNHYVEDDDAMFRFNYSNSFLNWALKAPGWRKEWHVGVRATKSRRLVAFISGIPTELRIRKATVSCSEVNFLCIHKKLRSKRLAPIMIQEITRRCYVNGIFQAIYTAGIVLPKPVSTCQYFHRSLNWEKLYNVGFAPLPPGSTKAWQISKNKLPPTTSTPGLRQMQQKDVDDVWDLLRRYLSRVDLAQDFSREEVGHWLLHQEKLSTERVVWTYVVEEPETHKLTDFFSFYALNSTVIGNLKYEQVRAAYLFYYATEAAFSTEKAALKTRLRTLMKDALIIARNEKFDVFNALTLLDNPLFLQDLRFKAGDGQLHYYLYNYRTAPIAGGLDPHNEVDAKYMGGVGMVML